MSQIRRRRLRSAGAFALTGALLGVVVGLVLGLVDRESLLLSVARGLTIGLCIGGGVGVGEELLLPGWSRRLGLRTLNALRITLYAAGIFLALTLVNAASLAWLRDLGPLGAVRAYFADHNGTRDLVLAAGLSILFALLMQLRRLHRARELWGLLSGRYYYPEQEERVFLFADIADSTGLAERLGPLEYSHLLRNCFSDISEAILAWGGSVYQHAGDSVIVSWPLAAGLQGGTCVRCFWEMVGSLESRADEYTGRFGTIPTLRGGIHGGSVVTTWVGEAKRELAFHGDTLNATSRVQGLCKTLGARLLVSGPIYARIEPDAVWAVMPLGEHPLRGRREPLVLVSVGPG